MTDHAAPLVDTHCHLMDEQLYDEREAVLERAAAAGVETLVCVGYDRASSEAAVALAERHPQIVATVGIHPNYAGQAAVADFGAVADLARHPRVVGIGETGLDYYRRFTEPEVQRRSLERHLALACELNLPVVVHSREAAGDTADALTSWVAGLPSRSRPPGVLHCFSGDAELGERCLGVGFLLSFAGPLTFKREGPLVDAARRAPADRIVVETDAPYLAPAPRRGTRNEPALVRLTFNRLAEIRAADPNQLASQTTENAARLFGLNCIRQPGGGA
jgi:TatD DNase family protein